jgi:hypothetical protein
MRKTTPVKQDGQRILRKHTLPERWIYVLSSTFQVPRMTF